ncbi:MAG TPA: DUF5605 domain-containing protein, partial [Bacillota bacterium]|nr:DUF5605 domain-containing protein [Bacillota bacterium]
IGFLRKILEQGPAEGLTPIYADWDSTAGGVPGDYYLFYYGFYRPSFRLYQLPPGVRFKVDIIDTWEMTITQLPGYFEGAFRIDLPGKEYMAVRMRKAE